MLGFLELPSFDIKYRIATILCLSRMPDLLSLSPSISVRGIEIKQRRKVISSSTVSANKESRVHSMSENFLDAGITPL